MTFLTDAECEALFMCEPPAGQTRRDQIEQILARHVAAALNAAADEIEADPALRLGHNVSVVCSCLRCEVARGAARIVRAASP